MEAAIERASDEARGIVATAAEGEIVGWLKLAPVRSVRKAFEQRYYRGLSCFGGDREGVWLVGCVLVHPRHRRRGLARSLVRCAIQIGTERGARAIEALPRRASFDVTDEELWMGPLGVFAALGFEEVHRTPDERASGAPDPYPVLRRELRRG
jgi:GNAT superfamily N-acetyltransferase